MLSSGALAALVLSCNEPGVVGIHAATGTSLPLVHVLNIIAGNVAKVFQHLLLRFAVFTPSQALQPPFAAHIHTFAIIVVLHFTIGSICCMSL